jgi:hypothetical protein
LPRVLGKAFPDYARRLEVAVSDSPRCVVTRLRAEYAREVDSGFARLRRIPQTDIIWFLDYFSSLTGPDREALLDALADWGGIVLSPPRGNLPAIAPALARLRDARNRPGSKGGTRYNDVKMLTADPTLREPGAYHASWRERFTPLHFQPRPDLLPSLSDLNAARAPRLRQLVDKTLTESLGLKREKQAGGNKYSGSSGSCELVVRIDFGSALGQLRYTVTLRSAGAQLLIPPISYETLWDVTRGWDYLTEENAPRSVECLAEQIAHLARLGEHLYG